MMLTDLTGSPELAAVSNAGIHPAVNVILFSGGRGSRVLSKSLINNARINLTVVINGYDDGASTGEIRKFLGNCLGPSDFRKNANRLARELRTCNVSLIDLLELRLPKGCDSQEAIRFLRFPENPNSGGSDFFADLRNLFRNLDASTAHSVTQLFQRFENELRITGQPFSFSDCSLGNLVFAGCFLEKGKDFNSAVDFYCSMLNLPSGLIENVTDGTNAYLVAVDRENRLLASEADIVNAKNRNYVKDIYLIDRALTAEEIEALRFADPESIAQLLQKRSIPLSLNPRLIKKIEAANLIIYSPGTQHSSLFPSYLTPGLGAEIAKNLMAIKLLVTNVQEDAEIPDASAVDIIEKAVRYLKEKNLKQIPTPCLITHYLINNRNVETPGEAAYVPLGRLENLEDPRMIRIANYEEGITGQHDPEKVLTPFVESILTRRKIQSVAVLLLGTESLNKICQTVLEVLRAGIDQYPVSAVFFYQSPDSPNEQFTSAIPFPLINIRSEAGNQFKTILQRQDFDYVILFECSGMYVGNDIVNLISLLGYGRLDAVWGSRRLSIRDIHASYKFRYRHNIVLGAISYVGSHFLSILYLLLYGRYISDTLSGLRALKPNYLRDIPFDLEDKTFNQQLLSILLKNRADIFETPVQFFPISPEQVRRTSVWEGLKSILTIMRSRFS
jgi:2-phospho-L-lactate transferase/gluconeogenesis factor (CofD/UPF0052 family)